MSKKKKEETNDIKEFSKLSPEELLKYEIAKEIGVYDKVLDSGWKSLSAKESGRIGGILSNRKRKMKQSALQSEATNNLED